MYVNCQHKFQPSTVSNPAVCCCGNSNAFVLVQLSSAIVYTMSPAPDRFHGNFHIQVLDIANTNYTKTKR